MKKWQKRGIAVVLALTLVIGCYVVGNREQEDSQGNEEVTVVSETADGEKVAVSDVSAQKEVSEQAKEKETTGNKDSLGDPERGVDYKQIMKEASDKKYRKNVKIEKNSFVVVRKETKKTKPLEQEKWYAKTKATANEEIMRTDSVDEQGKKAEDVTYRITTDKKDIWSVVDYTNNQDVVEIAEPVYTYNICDEGVPSETDNEGMSKQWYLKDQKTSDIWGHEEYGNTAGEGSVVAVIDTGVDYTHEDLQNNIWINAAELNGQDGVDDDGNGYVDDIYGINLIDPDGTPTDDHGHGTHVAGIIAMENNSTGGVGIAYKSKIMCIKAGGSDGVFNSTDIAKALVYARKNGADVINMSFGSYAHSAIMEQALQDAFSSSVLVAAAGNDNMPTLDAPVLPHGNMYPAAYSYVIGVMAYDSSEQLADFSNWDFKKNYGAEYEVAAPGVSIYSTLPDNRYASWNGTSMAAPVASAVAAVLRSTMPDKNTYSSRYIMGQIVSATEDSITYISPLGSYIYSKLSLKDSLTKSPKPNINVSEVYAFDSTNIAPENNGDGIIQPGETIDLAIGLRNQWGAATDVYVTANATSVGGVENTYVEFLTEKEMKVGDVGTFGTQNNGFVYDDNNTVTGVKNPIRVKISDKAPNDLNIQFNINYKAKNGLDENDTTVYKQKLDTAYTISIVKGTILSGKISEDMTLKSDEYYIVENSLLIPKGVTVKVEPGTKIQFWASDQSAAYGDDYIPYISVEGNMYFNGTESAPIDLVPGKDFESYRVQVEKSKNGTVNMSYVNITNPYIDISNGDHLNCIQDYDSIQYRDFDSYGQVGNYQGGARIAADMLSYSKISKLRGIDYWTYAEVRGVFDTVLFDDCQITSNGVQAKNCTFLNNQGRVEDPYTGVLQYFTSKMQDVGNAYMTPQYETVSKVYTLNNKKYVLYKFENFVYPTWTYDRDGTGHNNGYENFRLMETMIAKNGGHIANVAIEEEDVKELFGNLYKDVYGENETTGNSLNVCSGVYYDRDKQETATTNGKAPTSSEGFSSRSPLGYYYTYMQKYSEYDPATGEYVEKGYRPYTYQSITDGMQDYVLAEYPEDAEDYTVKNPVFDLEKLDIMESTKFTNNAILNRLTSKDTSDWMKISATADNKYTYMISGNYWGTTDEKLIQKQLIDFDTNIRYADYITSPNLKEPDKKTYPCVSSVYITDKDDKKVTTLGGGTYSVHVVFNRKMDTTVNPMVSYGPDDPYTDYIVDGEWVSDTEWVGKATIKVLVNQGQQYIRVKDAVAAEDSWLTTGTDWARFGFLIEATGAEALTLQGEGIKGAVYLNWVQDEYDTMAGFNVYRSESPDKSTFKKINNSVIASDTKEYKDKKVASGKKYYYYFTVVDTDMTESRPSNVISCASLDDQLPEIKHKEEKSITYGVNATITATITDNVAVNDAALYYRMEGDADYKRTPMVNTSGNTYSVQIPAEDLKVGNLQYYIGAADSVGYAYLGSGEEPIAVPVESKAVITAVKAENTEVGEKVKGKIKGANLAKNCKVRIDNEIVDSEFISDSEIDFEYVPTFMGKKKVYLLQNNTVVASFANAITVTDSSIKVYNNETKILKETSRWQYLYLNVNYTGILESLEVTSSNGIYCYSAIGCSGDSTEYKDDVMVRKFKFNNAEFSGGALIRYEYYNVSEERVPEIKSVKINGVEVQKVQYDKEKISFIDSNAYIPVDSIEAEEKTVTLDVGDSFTPAYSLSPTNATFRDSVTYGFPSDVLRQNEDGSFTAIRDGSFTMTIQCDEQREEISVYVKPLPVTEIKPKKNSYKGTVGNLITLEVSTEPSGTSTWVSWDYDRTVSQMSTSNNGRRAVFKLNEAGKTTVRAYVNDGVNPKVSCTIPITIVEDSAYVEIQEEILALYPNQTHSVAAEIVNRQEDDAEKITWTSSNTSVATVDEDGTISAVGKGSAVITGSIQDGKKKDTLIVLVGSDSMSYTLGDVNMDGSITSTDAMLALKMALMEEVPDAILKVADVNNDGSVTAADALRILQYVTGDITEF